MEFIRDITPMITDDPSLSMRELADIIKVDEKSSSVQQYLTLCYIFEVSMELPRTNTYDLVCKEL